MHALASVVPLVVGVMYWLGIQRVGVEFVESSADVDGMFYDDCGGRTLRSKSKAVVVASEIDSQGNGEKCGGGLCTVPSELFEGFEP